jgi:putative phage-type endonuclease
VTARVLLQRATRQVWLKHRARGLGGTDVAAVLGLNPWRTPLQVWLDKTDPQPDPGGGYAMRRGVELEAFLAREYVRAHPGVVLEKPPALITHPRLPWLRASLDRIAHHPDRSVVVELKTAGHRALTDWWDDTRRIPDHYAVQTLTYLMVTGLDEAHVVADLAGEWAERVIHRDLEWEAAAEPLLTHFWQLVETRTPPPADWGRDTVADLNRAWTPDPAVTIEADPDMVELVELARWTGSDRARATAAHDRARVRLRQAMEHATQVTIDGQRAAHITAAGQLRIINTK